MKIVIPSRDRAHLFRAETNPVRQMSVFQRRKWGVTYYVPSGDEDLYLSDAPAGLEVKGRPKGTIAEVRAWIGQQMAKEGHDKFLMLDDDIKWFRRVNTEETKLQPCTTQDLEYMLSLIDVCLDVYAAVGVSARQGNNNVGPCDQNSVDIDCRMMRAIAYRTEQFNAVEHNRVEVMEDFDIILQLLKSGFHVANLVWFAQEQGGMQSRGGCANWRTLERHNRSAEKLAELHPGIVKVREYKGKQGKDLADRKEVTIQWKKAFKNVDHNQQES